MAGCGYYSYSNVGVSRYGSVRKSVLAMMQAVRDSFLAAPRANSLIIITIRTCTHTNVSLQTIIYSKPNPNQKKIKFGARNPNPFLFLFNVPNGGR